MCLNRSSPTIVREEPQCCRGRGIARKTSNARSQGSYIALTKPSYQSFGCEATVAPIKVASISPTRRKSALAKDAQIDDPSSFLHGQRPRRLSSHLDWQDDAIFEMDGDDDHKVAPPATMMLAPTRASPSNMSSSVSRSKCQSLSMMPRKLSLPQISSKTLQPNLIVSIPPSHRTHVSP